MFFDQVKRFFQDVLDERREQIQEKLEQNRNNQLNVLKDRESLLQSIENDKRIAAEHDDVIRLKRQDLLNGLRSQLEERDDQIRREIDQTEKGCNPIIIKLNLNFFSENFETAQTQRELDDLEAAEEREIMTQPPTIRQAWR